MNYLDDFLFAALSQVLCNDNLNTFLDLCTDLGIPVSDEKTEWAVTLIVFLGILLDGKNRMLAIPEEKANKALHLLDNMIHKKKATVKELHHLAGLLNFLNKAIIPGCAFKRRMYSKFSGILEGRAASVSQQEKTLKPHHHVRLDSEFKNDCEMWGQFLLSTDGRINRPFIDRKTTLDAEVLDFYTDAAKGPLLGIGAVFNKNWLFGQWEPSYIENCNPSIEYLELLGICVAFFVWVHYLRNRRIVLFCDNQAVVTMVNNTTAKCKNCMVLIRKLTLKGLENNTRVFCHWVQGRSNEWADMLSRQKISLFKQFTQGTNICSTPTQLPQELWPPSKLWIK